MPASASLIANAVLQAGKGLGLNGSQMSPLAKAVGDCVASWLPSVILTAAVTGSAGVGTVKGLLTLPPHPAAAPRFTGMGFGGLSGPKLAQAISLGLSSAVTGTPYTGDSPVVGSGVATCKVLSANSAPLIASLVQSLPAEFASQSKTPQQGQLAMAIGTIVAEQMLLGFGPGVVVGSVSPASAVGTAQCRLVVS